MSEEKIKTQNNTQESFLSSIGSSAFWRVLDRGVGLSKHILIASMIGLSTQLDVFYMAMAILSVLVFSWGGVLDVATVPALVRLSKANKENSLKRPDIALFTAEGAVVIIEF